MNEISSEGLAIIYGLASAAVWGTGDFCGGLATKRTPVYTVIIFSQIIGGILLLALALVLGEPIPATSDLLIGGLAGVLGVIGLVALYSGLAQDSMGIVAPVAALVMTILPTIVGIVLEGLPSTYTLLGFGLALVAVWLLSTNGNGAKMNARQLLLPTIAGIGFGLFLVLIGGLSDTSVYWPLVAARTASVSFLLIVAAVRREKLSFSKDQLPLIAVAGIFDTGGNTFFALASQAGRLDIASVLGSLAPGGTVLLAWLILKEKLERLQLIGVSLALTALALIAL